MFNFEKENEIRTKLLGKKGRREVVGSRFLVPGSVRWYQRSKPGTRNQEPSLLEPGTFP